MLSAGTDPTHIPGLPGLDTVVTEPSQPQDTADGAAEGPAAKAEARDDATQDGEARTETDLEEATDEDTAPDPDEPPEGPAFDVSDHRSSIVADGRGVVFRLDDTEARFRWPDIGSVEIGASRFGKRFEVAVGTTDHRRFDAEVIAPTRRTIQQWTEDLDAVLDVWFDEETK
ncbi:hypothetical protein N566_08070 [Streptomycetaceae bacterium MP113-05]|nr:hypothetical protein N566_08070 [Streptomycetaceae bacterium MP113-05]